MSIIGASVFAVNQNDVQRGAPVEHYVLPSTRIIPAILVGDSNKPGYVPVKNLSLPGNNGPLALTIEAASIDWSFPWTPQLVPASPYKTTDKACIVVFRTDIGRENHHCGVTRDSPLPGRNLTTGRIRPCYKRFGCWQSQGSVQLVQCVPRDEVFSTVVTYGDGSELVHAYRFTGEMIELMPPAF